MAKQTINIGQAANDGTGDPLHTAFDKTNQNFTEVYTIAQNAEPQISTGTSSQYWRGDKTFQNLNKAAVGLNFVDNTSDVSKPISTAQQAGLDGKINTGDITVAANGATMPGSSLLGRSNSSSGAIFPLSVSQVKTFLVLDQVSNTADADKPISTATQTALDLKFNKSDTALATALITTASSQVLLGRNSSGAGAAEELTPTLAKQILGLSNVNNTADADKPISTATQTALNLKMDANTMAIQTSQVQGLDNALANKMNVGASVNISQVTNLQTTLDAKVNTTDLTTALALKADKTQLTYSVKTMLSNMLITSKYYGIVDTAFTAVTALVNVISAPNEDTVLDITQNTTSIGTLTIKAGTTGLSSASGNASLITFAWTNGLPTFAIGDILVVTPTSGVDNSNPGVVALLLRN